MSESLLHKKKCLLIPIRNRGRVVVISKAMESFYFEVDNL